LSRVVRPPPKKTARGCPRAAFSAQCSDDQRRRSTLTKARRPSTSYNDGSVLA
jgi:hypothetical protein